MSDGRKENNFCIEKVVITFISFQVPQSTNCSANRFQNIRERQSTDEHKKKQKQHKNRVHKEQHTKNVQLARVFQMNG